MKKITFYVMTICLSLTFYPHTSNAAFYVAPTAAVAPTCTESEEAKTAVERLDKIKSMDKSSLSFSEKRSLRKEVRSTRHRLKEIGGGVYISVGALIVIIIILVIIL